MQDSLFNNLHGVVECYENGKRKWVTKNKITTLGRTALLSTMAKADFYWPGGETTEAWLRRNDWKFDYNSAYISLFAIGDGGKTNDNGLPTPAKFTDTTLTKLVPIIDKDSIKSDSIFNRSLYVDIYAEWYKNGIKTDTDELIEEGGYAVQNRIATNAPIRSKNDIYFKKVSMESDPTSFEFRNKETSARYITGGDNDLISIKCALARFKLEVSGRELLTVTGGSPQSINELSLYISSIYERQNTQGTPSQMFFSYPAKEKEEGEPDYPIIPGKYLTLPIQFSRVTFPTEVFDTDEKNVTFIYNIFA